MQQTDKDLGEIVAADTVRFRRLLPGPIERVWEHLVDGDKRGRWLCSGRTEAEVGGAIRMVFRNEELSDRPDVSPPAKYADHPKEQTFTGTVTACDPPRRFGHTWELGDERSEVVYELDPRGDEVLLTVTQRRLPARDLQVGVSAGWHTHLDLLEDLLRGGSPRAFWKRFTEMEAVYEQRIPT